MKFIVITGLSGAGRTRALRCLEDMNFYCVDNLPPVLVSKFAEMCSQSQGKLDHVAVVVDVRSGSMFRELRGELTRMQEAALPFELLFLDANDATLIARYKETRRSHPLSPGGRAIDGIVREREILEDIKRLATHTIDTSHMQPQHLKKRMRDLFSDASDGLPMTIDIMSFGFKYGIPLDSDLVFDVRFLPNPFYEPELKPMTGLDEPVREYIMAYPQSRDFCDRLLDMVQFLIPQYAEEGKSNLVISIGCTGGKHRSVTVAAFLAEALSSRGTVCRLLHRDKEKA
ncbi:MAG: RNase adapter RapZ [Clostridia bacterium]|nr:RNase adapter RapZ [Oscillospiraceae bacterium]MBQ7034000.1 RNase adapter RapZ [Clostridia bacterium]